MNSNLELIVLFGCVVFAIIVFIVFMTNIKGIIKASEAIVPILIIALIIIGIINILKIQIGEVNGNLINYSNGNFFIKAILYCSYNSILLIPVLITLKDYLKDRNQIAKISIASTIIIIMLSILVYLLLVNIKVDISNIEMPAVYVVANYYPMFKNIYGIVILGSIFTTSIALGGSFLQNTVKSQRSYPHIAVIMCITSVIISKFGFSSLVNYVYPIFGYLGILQIIKIGI